MTSLKLIVCYIIFNLLHHRADAFDLKLNQSVLDGAYNFAEKFVVMELNSVNISAECAKHMERYVHGIKNLDIWALKMLDATAKLQSGLLRGNLFNLGDYDECRSISNVPVAAANESHALISSKYCLGKITVEAIPGNNGLYWALCAPDTCTVSDLNALMRAIRSPVVFSEDDCHSKSQDPVITTGDVILITCFSAIGLILITATIFEAYAHYAQKEDFAEQHPLLVSFSVIANGKKLFAMPQAKNADQMGCLAGVRWISMMWVVLGHTYTTVPVTMAMTNSEALLIVFDSPWSMYVRGATVAVDTFFLMSGMLIVYVYLKSKKSLNILLMYFHRYLRLTPALAAIVAVHTTIMKHFGQGPFWKNFSRLSLESCYEYWWTNLLYIQNIVNPLKTCVVTSWYLAVDMQLFLISPLILIPLKRWTRITLSVVLIGMLASTASSFAVAYIYKLVDYNTLENSNEKLRDYVSKYYSVTYCRAGPWLIGIILGYVMHKVKHTGRKFRIKKIWNACFWTCALSMMIVCVFYDMAKDEYDRIAKSAYIAFVRPAWAFALSWLIFACVTGHGGPINAFLSLPIFQVLARLSYTIYLTHLSVIAVIYASRTQPVEMSHGLVMYIFWGNFAATIFLSIIWTLTFESPIISMEKYLLGGGRRKRRTSEHSDAVKSTATKDSTLTLATLEKMSETMPYEGVLIGSSSTFKQPFDIIDLTTEKRYVNYNASSREHDDNISSRSTVSVTSR